MTELIYTLQWCLDRPLMDVDLAYQRGLVSREIVDEYCTIWNRGPHFSVAQLRDGAIRLTHKRETS